MRKLIKSIVVSTALLAGMTGAAFADTRSEAFVEENANAVLETLNQPTLSSEERTEKFNDYMNTFADVQKIARFVLGSYGRGLSEDEFDRYFSAFHTYSMAVYEVQLDQFRGEDIEVVGSVDLRDDGSDSVVQTTVHAEGEDFTIEWRVRKQRDTEFYKVLDVALNLDGSQIWLAQEQRAQFVSLLDRSNGDIDTLITRINEMTTKLRTEAAAGVQSNFNENRL